MKKPQDMVALPFCRLTLNAAKPKNPFYPKELNTLGDHLRKRRLDLGLTQQGLADQIICDEATITNWELNRVTPALQFWPRILEFLGYDPSAERGDGSLADRLKRYRRSRGLSRKMLAGLLGTHPSNLAGWETGRHRPTKRSLELIDQFLAGDGRQE